jgi:hypothetical protein
MGNTSCRAANHWGAVFGLLALLAAPIATAADVYLEGRFSFDGTRFKFENLTSPSGTCALAQHRAMCEREGIVTVAVPGIRGEKDVNDSTGESRWYANMPAGYNGMFLRGDAYGREFSIRIAAVAFGYRLTRKDGSDLPLATPHQAQIANSCKELVSDTSSGLFILAGATGDSWVCWNKGISNPAISEISDVEFAYQIGTNDWSFLPNGVYSGTKTWQLNQKSQTSFGFGEGYTLNDNQLNVHVKIIVEHEFDVRFPSENPTVYLSPRSGWDRWINGGPPPARLESELPFSLTTTSELSVKMRCGYRVEDRCGIKNVAESTYVPIDVDITIPGTRELGTGRPGNQFPLVTEHSGRSAPRFSPDSFLENAHSHLRFSAGGAAVGEMVKAPGSHWEGDVTVIFDTNL